MSPSRPTNKMTLKHFRLIGCLFTFDAFYIPCYERAILWDLKINSLVFLCEGMGKLVTRLSGDLKGPVSAIRYRFGEVSSIICVHKLLPKYSP